MKKKGTIKKSAAKKTSRTKKKELVQAFGPYCFWVHNGPVLSNLKELRDALATMSDSQYAHHAHDERNDFAVWVIDILGEKTHGKKLHTVASRKDAIKVVNAALKFYH